MVVYMTSPLDALLRLHRTIEARPGDDELRACFTDDAVVVEQPNALRPTGGESDLDAVVAGARAGAALLAWERYDLDAGYSVGDTAIARVDYEAEVSVDRPPFRAGQRIRGRIAQFADIRDGRVARLVTYDCIEPIA